MSIVSPHHFTRDGGATDKPFSDAERKFRKRAGKWRLLRHRVRNHCAFFFIPRIRGSEIMVDQPLDPRYNRPEDDSGGRLVEEKAVCFLEGMKPVCLLPDIRNKPLNALVRAAQFFNMLYGRDIPGRNHAPGLVI